jgi:hypothetical protein
LNFANSNTEAVFEIINTATTDPVPEVRLVAVKALGLAPFYSQARKDVITALSQALSDPDEDVRLAASEPLGWIREDEKDSQSIAIPALIKALTDESAAVHETAANTLFFITHQSFHKDTPEEEADAW